MATGIVKIGIAIVIVIILLIGGAAAYYFVRIAPLIKSGKKEASYSASSRPDVSGFGFETDKRTAKIADLKGKIVVVDVWATWCGPCIRSIPNVIALQNKYKDKPVEIIGLNVDSDGWQVAKPFIQKRPDINYTMAVPSPAPAFLLKAIVDLPPLGEVSAIPTIFVIDQRGRLAAKFVEVNHEQDVDNLIAKLLAEESSK